MVSYTLSLKTMFSPLILIFLSKIHLSVTKEISKFKQNKKN